MSDIAEPTSDELRRIAAAILDDAQRVPQPSRQVARPADWALSIARAAWSLGARHDGRGELHGPVEQIGGENGRVRRG